MALLNEKRTLESRISWLSVSITVQHTPPQTLPSPTTTTTTAIDDNTSVSVASIGLSSPSAAAALKHAASNVNVGVGVGPSGGAPLGAGDSLSTISAGGAAMEFGGHHHTTTPTVAGASSAAAAAAASDDEDSVSIGSSAAAANIRSTTAIREANELSAARIRLVQVMSAIRTETRTGYALYLEWWKYSFDALNCVLELVASSESGSGGGFVTNLLKQWMNRFPWLIAACGFGSALCASARVWRQAGRQIRKSASAAAAAAAAVSVAPESSEK